MELERVVPRVGHDAFLRRSNGAAPYLTLTSQSNPSYLPAVQFEGRSAIVTGGAGGLGSATVRRLAGLGMGVVVFDRDGERAAALAGELPGSVAVSGDTVDDDAVVAAIEAARHLGPLSVLVNVAGGGVGAGRTVGRDGKPHDKAAFVQTLEMNALGTFNVTRLVAAAMADNEPGEDGERGVVVHTASIAAVEGQIGRWPTPRPREPSWG